MFDDTKVWPFCHKFKIMKIIGLTVGTITKTLMELRYTISSSVKETEYLCNSQNVDSVSGVFVFHSNLHGGHF